MMCRTSGIGDDMNRTGLVVTFGGCVVWLLATASASAQVPPDIAAGLKKIGQVVDPACTAKLYRPLMPKNDYNTYWAPNAAAPSFKGQLYPGITITRDQSFGPHPKDVLDIFVADAGGGDRPVLIFVPGGGGNKIEQQVRESNAFYDNIGRWATKNGMVAAVVQRHAGPNWDDGGRDLSMAVDWLKENVTKFKGDPNRMVIWAHSAGNGPLGVYVGHPERWKNGVQVQGAIFMSGNPVPGIVPAQGGGAAPGAPGSRSGVACGLLEAQAAGPVATGGAIAGPSSVLTAVAAPAAPAGGRGGQTLTAEQQAERDNLPGFKKTPVRVMLARAELDPGVSGEMLPADKALHDAMCAVDGPRAKDGEGHCPSMLFLKGESHMSEVFSFDTADRIVSGPILAWMKRVK
jgi:pimeloyl-ACP methyl ester carboxylesterase